MEQVRLLLAIVLSFIVFLIWNAFFVGKTVPPSPAKPKAAVVEKTNAAGKGSAPVASPMASIEKTVKPALPPAAASGQSILSNRPDRQILVENSLYKAEFSEKAGAITQFVLKKYCCLLQKDQMKAIGRILKPRLSKNILL